MQKGIASMNLPAEWRAGWGIVLVATLGIAVAGIHFHVVGALAKPLEAAYGWTRGQVTLALTVSSVLAPFTNIGVGWLADRFGPRAVLLAGLPLFCLSFALLGFAGPAVWAWYIGYGVFAVFAQGTSPVAWTMAVVRNFTIYRGLALAISLSGGGVLVSTIPAVVYTLVERVGVPGTFFAIGFAAFILVWPAAFLILPRTHASERTGQDQTVLDDHLAGLTIRQALSAARFWQLAAGFLIVATCVGTFVVHFQPMLTDAGLSTAEAGRVALFIGPALIFGRIATGMLFDRIDARIVATAAFLLPGLGCLMLMNLNDSLLYASVTALVLGIGMGAEFDVLAFLTSRYFGLKHYGLIFGILSGLYGLGVGAGSSIAGFTFDWLGGYDPFLQLQTAFVAVAAVLIASLGRPPDFLDRKPHDGSDAPP